MKKIKKYVLTEEQITRMVMALNGITVTGLQQAELLTVCKQAIDSAEVIEEEGAEDERN